MSKLNLVSFPELKSDRLLLRQLGLADTQAIFELRSNKEVSKFVDRQLMELEDQALAFINKINSGIASNKWLYWAITTLSQPTVMGTICLWQFSEKNNAAEIGFEMHPDHQRNGYSNEALAMVLKYAFKTLNLEYINGVTHEDNLPAIALMRKQNFHFVKKLNNNEKSTQESSIPLVLFRKLR